MAGISQIYADGFARDLIPRSTAPTFLSSTSYAVGDYVYYQGNLYRCTTAHTGTWVASHFTAVTIGSELKAKEAEIADVKTDLILNHPLSFTEENKYIKHNNGNTASASGLNYVTAYVEGASYINYRYTFSNPDLRGLAFYDANGSYISGLQALATTQTYVAVPTNAVTCKATVTSVEQLCVITTVDKILENFKTVSGLATKANALVINPSAYTETNKYIKYETGKVASISGLNYVTVSVKGVTKINYTYTVTNADARGIAFYDDYGQFISGLQTTSSAQLNISIPSNASTCKATVTALDQLSIVVDMPYVVDTLSNTESKSNNILSAFSNITCIGDSLTWGQVYTANGTSRQAYNPYPVVLGKRTGATIESFAQKGASASQVWTAFESQLTSKTAQLFIIYLGTNNGLTDTLSTDAPVGTDYTTWSDTNTGCYAKLIAKAQSVGGKVLLIKCAGTSGDLETTNSVIDQCGTRFGCGVIGTIYSTDLKYHYYPDLSGSNMTHFNDLGYSAFADALIKSVGQLNTDQMKYLIPS